MTGHSPWYAVATACTYAAYALVLASLLYAACMLWLSRHRASRRWQTGLATRTSSFVVFVLPCLDEARVIGASLDRLLATPGEDFAILVVDDGSSDKTASIVLGYDNPKVKLLRRVAPDCRQGKGEALNAAYRYLVTGPILAGYDPRDVIIAILDADGRLEEHALDDVLPLFGDPHVGGVQIGVRINNRHTSWLARMQDFEFVVFTGVFQQARRHLGSVGLGGNGQFMRMSALMSLGDAPWTRSLTEDLDLGVRLLSAGWRNEYCPTAFVHQQGISELGRLVRQRTRWFQGHLQSWALLPTVLRSTYGRARRDLFYHLTGPLLLLLASLMTASFLLGLVAQMLVLSTGGAFVGWWLVGAYALSVVPSIVLSRVYWRQERRHGMSRLRAVGLAHGYVVYCLMWYVAGWRAAWRTFVGDTGWTKTTRTVETDDSTLEPDRMTALRFDEESVPAPPATAGLGHTASPTSLRRAHDGEASDHHSQRHTR